MLTSVNASPAFRLPRLEGTSAYSADLPTYRSGHSTAICSYINLHAVDLLIIHPGTTPPNLGRSSAI